MKVCKFGGSSLADAAQFRKVKAILAADPERRYVVCSAPGKGPGAPDKVTDLLIQAQALAAASKPFDEPWEKAAARFRKIASELGVGATLEGELAEVRGRLAAGCLADEAASRGEYLNSLLMAEFLGWPFLDAAHVVRFGADGRLKAETTNKLLAEQLSKLERAVIPGFYGAQSDGTLRVFSRGGSDVSGALAARAAKASVYENWTDVSGLRITDPKVVPGAAPIDVITYRELRELSYMGATVLHEEALFPVRSQGIPVQLRNTNEPADPGTRILAEAPASEKYGGLSGIAGKRGFTVIALEKALMNQELGFGRRVLDVLARHGVSYEHTPTGIDSFSVVAASAQLEGRLQAVIDELRAECRPDEIEVFPEMALVAVVGRGMRRRKGVAARLFGALAQAGINIRMIDQGASELNIIVGVESSDLEAAVRAIYAAFVGKDT